MIPGEMITAPGEIELNTGRRTLEVTVANTGDRPIQVGSHYHFFETNEALRFERDATRGMRLNIPAGTAVRFEPGQERKVELVEYEELAGWMARAGGALCMAPLIALLAACSPMEATQETPTAAPAQEEAARHPISGLRIAPVTITTGFLRTVLLLRR